VLLTGAEKERKPLRKKHQTGAAQLSLKDRPSCNSTFVLLSLRRA